MEKGHAGRPTERRSAPGDEPASVCNNGFFRSSGHSGHGAAAGQDTTPDVLMSAVEHAVKASQSVMLDQRFSVSLPEVPAAPPGTRGTKVAPLEPSPEPDFGARVAPRMSGKRASDPANGTAKGKSTEEAPDSPRFSGRTIETRRSFGETPFSPRAGPPEESAPKKSIFSQFVSRMEQVALHGVSLEFSSPTSFAVLMTVIAVAFHTTWFNLLIVHSARHLDIDLSRIDFSSSIVHDLAHPAWSHASPRSLRRAAAAEFALVLFNLALLCASVVSLLVPRLSNWVFERRDPLVLTTLMGFTATLIPGFWVVHDFFTWPHALHLGLALSVVLAITLKSCKSHSRGRNLVVPWLIAVPLTTIAALVEHGRRTDAAQAGIVVGSLALVGLGPTVWQVAMFPRALKAQEAPILSEPEVFTPERLWDRLVMRATSAWRNLRGAIRGRLVLIAAILVSVGWVCILGSWAVVTVVMVLASSVQIDSTLLFLFLLINFSVLRWGSFMGITAREEVIRNLVPLDVAKALITKTARHPGASLPFGQKPMGRGAAARRSLALEDGAFRKTVAARARGVADARTPLGSGRASMTITRAPGGDQGPANTPSRFSMSVAPAHGPPMRPSAAALSAALARTAAA